MKSTETANKGIYFIIHMKIKKQIPHKRISYGLAFFASRSNARMYLSRRDFDRKTANCTNEPLNRIVKTPN